MSFVLSEILQTFVDFKNWDEGSYPYKQINEADKIKGNFTCRLYIKKAGIENSGHFYDFRIASGNPQQEAGVEIEKIFADFSQYSQNFNRILSDSRKISSADIFIAIKGERYDAHDFCDQVINKGCRCLILNYIPLNLQKILESTELTTDLFIILTPSTLCAYAILASYYRRKYLKKLIGITGSVGKTCIRQMLSLTLGVEKKAYSTLDNLNNEVGVPQTILNCPDDSEYLCLEMGMDHFGDLAYIAPFCDLDYAVISNIGYSHIGHFCSLEKLALGKSHIFSGLKENGKAIINAKSQELLQIMEAEQQKYQKKKIENIAVLYYFTKMNEEEIKNSLIYMEHLYQKQVIHKLYFSCTSKHSKFFIAETAEIVKKTEITEKLHQSNFNDRLYFFEYDFNRKQAQLLAELNLKIKGEHYNENATFALTTANEEKLNLTLAAESLSTFEKQIGNRCKIYDENNIKIFNDSYNASLNSIEAAFDTYFKIEHQGRKVAVLGCVVEMGNFAEYVHKEIGKLLHTQNFDSFFLLGEYIKVIIKELMQAYTCIDISSQKKLDTFLTDKNNNILENIILLRKSDNKIVNLRAYAGFNYDREKLINDLLFNTEQGDFILFKASHAYDLENLCSDFLNLYNKTDKKIC